MQNHSPLAQWEYKKYRLQFYQPAGTSRGILNHKDVFFIKVAYTDKQIYGLGECGTLPGLSIDHLPDLEVQIDEFCKKSQVSDIPNRISDVPVWVEENVPSYLPALGFAVECALLDLLNGGLRTLFENPFLSGDGIPINGLVWMGSRDEMISRITQKVEQGYDTIKIKVGALEFQEEVDAISFIRATYSDRNLTIRLDANGAFSVDECLQKLDVLSRYDIHSIEQPIKAGNWSEMHKICEQTPIPVALDEELIGITGEDRANMLDTIKPHYIILKPSLAGGLFRSVEWIDLAEDRDIGWWITSALESNLGLNAIAQFTAEYRPAVTQGLGTGQLFSNNFASPLFITEASLYYDQKRKWDLSELGWR